MRVFRLGYPRRGPPMKKSKFTEQQIAFALQQAEGGTPVD